MDGGLIMPINIKGQTSGSTTITAPNTGGDETIELSTALGSKLPIAGGKILQIVRATDSTQRTTTSATPVDVTGMSVTITPQKSDSAIFIICTANVFSSATGGAINNSLFFLTDNSNNGLSGAQSQVFFSNAATNAILQAPALLWGYSTPATLSATTYKLRFLSPASTNCTSGLANNTNTGQMYAIEVSA
jgi:hypothetical protein